MTQVNQTQQKQEDGGRIFTGWAHFFCPVHLALMGKYVEPFLCWTDLELMGCSDLRNLLRKTQ